MPIRSPQAGALRLTGELVLFALGYLLLHELGFWLAFPPAGVAAFGPAAGLAVAVLARRRRADWPLLVATVLLVNLAGNLWHGQGVALSLSLAVTGAAEAVAGGWLLARYGGDDTGSGRWVLRGLLPAATVAAAAGAVCAGLAVQAAGAAPVGFGAAWWSWFSADALGILIVTPAVRALSGRPPSPAGSWWKLAEAGGLVLAQLALVLLVFAPATGGPHGWLGTYLVLPGMLWAVVRPGPRFTAVLSAGLTVVVLWGTGSGGGPFAQASVGHAVLGAQGFCLVVLFSSFVLASVLATSKAATTVLRRQTAVMTYAMEGIAYVGANGCYEHVNPAYADQLRSTPAELIGRRWEPTADADDLDSVRAAYQDMLAGGKATMEARGLRADGTTFFWELTMVADRDAAGLLRGHHCFLRDIDDRRAAADHVDQLFRLSPSLLCVLDAEGRFRRLNPAWEHTLGYPPEAMLGRLCLDFIHPDDVAEAIAVGARTASLSESVAVDSRYRCADGTYRWISWNFGRGAERGLIYAVGRDITDSKRTEDVLAHGRDEALEASRMKSQFLATMSHEIRTPMNGVIGLTDLLYETPLEPTQRRYVDGINTAGAALLNVINDILDFAKIEAGKFVLDDVDFHLAVVVNEVAALTEQTAGCKGLQLQVELDPELPDVVRGDPGRLRQILLNLVGNAIKFTAAGSVTIRAYPQPGSVADASPACVCVEVADTGIGMDAEGIDRLFEPFQQTDASTTREYGGTGLGLAISGDLIKAMGGTITVDSTLAVGTTVRLALPLPVSTGSASSDPIDPNLLQILIVDDNPINRLTLLDQVTGWGMHGDVADDPEQALELLRQAAAYGRRYDIAIIDMQMPRMSGLELADAIAAHPAIPNLPVILMTSGDAITSTEAKKAAISATLTKPVSQSTLYDALATISCRGEDPADEVVRGRILLVEDNEINQTVATHILVRLGYTVDVAQDGLEALECAEKRSYQAILMDCQMPRMDGYTATSRLRDRPATARTPIIAMTANVFKEERERCLAAGMDDYLPKPVRAHDLDATLLRWTATTGLWPTDPTAPGSGSVMRDRLEELLGGHSPAETAFIQKIARSFIDRAPGMINDLGLAIGQGDSAAVAFHSHSLKGVAANIGAQPIAEISEAIEQLARSGDLAAVPGQHARLSAVLDRTGAELIETLAALCRTRQYDG